MPRVWVPGRSTRRARASIKQPSGATRGASSRRACRVALLVGPPSHGYQCRGRRSRWTRPREGSSTSPSEGARACDGRGTGRACRRAKRRARLPETHGHRSHVHVVAGMALPLRRRIARGGVRAEAQAGEHRLTAVVARRRGAAADAWVAWLATLARHALKRAACLRRKNWNGDEKAL